MGNLQSTPTNDTPVNPTPDDLLTPANPLPLGEIRRRFRLTQRQAEVALRLYWRRTNKEIARELGLSVKTAQDYAATVLRLLNVDSRRDVATCLRDDRRP